MSDPELVLEPLEEQEPENKHEPRTSTGDGNEAIELPEVSIPEEGSIYKARITRIEKGRLRDFVDIERVAESLRARGLDDVADRYIEQADDPAIRIEFMIEELGAEGDAVYRVSFNPKSNYYKLLRLYGRLDKETRTRRLRVGDYIVVKAVMTQSGRLVFRPVLDDPSVLDLLR